MTDPEKLTALEIVACIRNWRSGTDEWDITDEACQALVDRYAQQRFADAAAECALLREQVATAERERAWASRPDTFAVLTLRDAGDDDEERPAVTLTGTREQVAIAARWLGTSVALSGSADLLNAYRREASDDSKTITQLKADLKRMMIGAANDSSEIATLSAELHQARRQLEDALLVMGGPK